MIDGGNVRIQSIDGVSSRSRRDLVASAAAAFLVAVVAVGPRAAHALPGDIQTYAGGTARTGNAASISLASSGVAAFGNYAFIADNDFDTGPKHVVRRIDLTTGEQIVVAGTGAPGFSGDGGPATAAATTPIVVGVDGSGNVYIADDGSRIRRVDAVTGIISTVVGNGTYGSSGDGGPATAASLSTVIGIAFDVSGNMFIADVGAARVRRVDAVTGIITTVVGTGVPGYSGDGGPATAAQTTPVGIALDAAGNLFVSGDGRVRRIDAMTGIISTVAGPLGTAGIAIDAAGDLFVADPSSNRVRRIDGVSWIISTVAGTGTAGYSGDGGPATAAALRAPWGVATTAAGELLIADTENRRIRRVAAGVISTLGGNGEGGFSGDGGLATNAQLYFPTAVAIAPNGDVAVCTSNRIRKIEAGTRVITTIAGTGVWGDSGDGGPATAAQIREVRGMAYDPSGGLLIADHPNDRVRRIDPLSGIITTIAGTSPGGYSGDGGPATAAQLSQPVAVASDGAGNLFIADTLNNRVRRVDGITNTITTVAGTGAPGSTGDGGPATAATLDLPLGIAVDAFGNVFVATSNRVRRISASMGIITTVAGGGVSGTGEGVAATAVDMNPVSLAVDAGGNLFIADAAHDRVRRVDSAIGTIATVAGNGTESFGGDGGAATAAALTNPFSVAIDPQGNLMVTDTGNHRVRRVAGPAITCGDGDVQTGIEECDDGGTAPNDGCDATCKLEDETHADTVGAGGTVTIDTGNEGATPSKPVQAAVTTPSGGSVEITRTGAAPSDEGYRTVGGRFVITAPDESVATPLALAFRIDASLIPSGQDETTLRITRDLSSVAECEGAPQAIPDPCVSSRVRMAPDVGQLFGDVVLTVLSSHASEWAFAADACGTVPAGGCLHPVLSGKAQLQIKQPVDPAKHAFSWKWGAGAATDLAAFGDPSMTSDYALCVYDDQGGTPVRRLRMAIAPGGTCKGKPCWKGSTTGWQYKKSDFVPKGQLQIKLKSGVAGKAQIAVKAQGPHLGLAMLPATQSPSVRVQLNNGAGRCWEAVYSTNTAKDGAQFKAKSD